MESVDITIIGAGIIGLSVASVLSQKNKNIFILEKNTSWGQEASSRNSEVVHAGIYYNPGSLKAIACYEGRNELYTLCPEHNIGIKKTGKLIVATDQREIGLLEKLKETARNNGVDLSFLDGKDVKKVEPEACAVAALYSPETGIVDSHFLMKFFLDKARAGGVELVCDAEVIAIERKESQYKITLNNQGEKVSILSNVVVNCAGNNADKVASLCGINIEKEGYEQYYLKGNYFRLSDQHRNKTSHLIYPVPDKNSLGIHTVLDLSGGIRLGPDEEEVLEMDYQVNPAKKKAFYNSAKKFLPCIDEKDLSSDMAGIRSQLRHPNKGDFKDFIINHEQDKGLPGLINLLGIESPGLTASPYIGKYVGDIIDSIL